MTRILLILILVSIPSLAQAFTTDSQEDVCAPANTWVIMCENFENRALGNFTGSVLGAEFKNQGWCGATTCGTNAGGMSVVNTEAFDGTKSMQMFFPNGATSTDPNSKSAGFATINLTPGLDYYFRSYVKHSSNFVFSPNADKWLYFNTNDNPNNTVLVESGSWGGSAPRFCLNCGTIGTVVYENVGQFSFQDNVWYCTEFHVKINTANQANGTIEGWIDGSPVFSYVNNISVNTTGNAFNNFMISGFWNCYSGPCQPGNPIDQHPDQYRWHDNIVVATQRIGCLGAAPPPDTTSPQPVTNLAVNNNASGQPVLTWTNGTDNVGVTGQTIKRCVGTSCTPVTIYATLSGINTTYTDLQTVGGTVYGYQVNDFDAAGNQGTYSSIVSDTSGVTTNRTTTFTDNFTRADNVSLGVNYDSGYTGFFAPQIVSNAVEESSTANPSLATYNGVLGNDQFACVTLSTFNSGDASAVVGTVQLRFAAPPTVSGYYLQARVNSSATTLLRRVDSGTQTTLLTENSTNWGQGDQLCGEINGTTLTVYRNNTAILSATDATYASGRAGFQLFNGTAFTNSILDDFTIGTLGAPAPEPLIASAACNTTGCTLTYGTTTPTQIRVARGSNSGQYDSTIYPIASFPAGRYSVPGGAWVGGLTYVCFYAINASGTENDVSNAYLCQSLVGIAPATDTIPVALSNGVPSSNLAAGTTSTIISATLDKSAACRYDTTDPAGSDLAAYNSLANAMSVSSFTASATVTGLTNGSTHTYYVRCNFVNSLGTNIPNPTSLAITVIVDNATPDTVAPSTVTGLTATALGQSQATLTWNAATAHGTKTISGYFAYSCFAANCSDATQATPTIITTTTVILNLSPATTYYFCVKAVDSANILSAACSNIPASITTGPVVDVIPPSDMANLRQIGVFQNSAVLTWDQGTDNSGAVTTTIEMSPAGCAAFSVIVSRLTLTQLVVNLAPSSTYCFRGKFSDASGNVSVNYSNVLQVTTNSAGLPRPRLHIPSSRSSTPRTGTGTRTPR